VCDLTPEGLDGEEKPMNAEIQVVITELEAARLAQLQRLMVCDIATSASEIRSLAELQMALTAAKEILAAHEPRLGHGSETAI
jgi:predicted DNA-binding protein (UPF0251 family)